jgi:hypothetical protein
MLKKNLPNIEDDVGQVQSVFPCIEYLTFGPWLYLVPQYKPKNVLILGYGGGTAAGLIRMFYGDVPITAVDIEDCSEFNFYNVELIQADAREYIKTCKRFDAVIIDMFQAGSRRPVDFVFSDEFVGGLGKKARYIIVHANEDSDMSAYTFTKVRELSTGAKSTPTPRFYYYMVEDINELPVR